VGEIRDWMPAKDLFTEYSSKASRLDFRIGVDKDKVCINTDDNSTLLWRIEQLGGGDRQAANRFT
jgi:hypothetical protein